MNKDKANKSTNKNNLKKSPIKKGSPKQSMKQEQAVEVAQELEKIDTEKIEMNVQKGSKKSKGTNLSQSKSINEEVSKVHGADNETAKTLNKSQSSSSLLSKCSKGLVILLITVLAFNVGQYYETRKRNTVYVLDEKKFLKLASVGIATGDKNAGEALSNDDKEKVRTAISELNTILGRDYSKYPILIQKQGSYALYSSVTELDVTKDIIRKVIGEKRWEEIGNKLG